MSVRNDFNFITFEKHFPKVRRNIAVRLAELAAKHFKDSFHKGGFVDETLVKWEPSRRERNGRGKTLIDTGALRNSIKAVKRNYNQSVITSNISYAFEHNEGTNGQLKRKFLGRSAVLDRASMKIIAEEMNKIFEK